MRHRFLARLGTVTGLFVVLHACGGDDREFASGTGGDGGASGGGGKATGGGGSKATGGSGGKSSGGAKATGGSDAGAGGTGATGATAGTEAGGTDAGGTGTGGAGGNEAGAGGEPVVVVDPGRPGSALISGGNVMTSAKYRLVLTTGEGPGGTQVLKSQNYKLIGGLIGTTEH